MSANEIHLNDIGTKFLVTVKDGSSVVNVSTASTKQIIIKKPSGATLTKQQPENNPRTANRKQQTETQSTKESNNNTHQTSSKTTSKQTKPKSIKKARNNQ